jgi:uncharacterized protein (DUF58 family)
VAKLWLPAWVTPRFLWTLAAIALLLACAPGVPLFVWLAALLGVALAVATLADALVGPPPSALRVARLPPAHFALGVQAELSYTIENRSKRTARVGIVETPVPALRFDVDECIGEVPSRSRVTLIRTVTPISRGAAELQRLYFWYENALGLVRRRCRTDAPQSVGRGAIRPAPRAQPCHRGGTAPYEAARHRDRV